MKPILSGFLQTCLLLSFTGVAFAQADVSTQVEKIKDLTPSEHKNYMPGSEEIDDMITNKNLRALSGSVSRWSVATQFNYNAGSWQTPLAQDRPNIADASGTTTKSDLDGSIWIKYNIDVRNSLMAGFGTRWIAPLEKNGPSNYDGTTFDAVNPEIQYQHLYKIGGVQAVLQISLMQWTQADQTAHGYAQQLNIDQENMYEFGESGLSIGASTWIQYQWFNKSGSFGDPKDTDDYIADLHSVQSVYAFSISPVVEYELTEKLNLRASAGLWQYEHYLSQKNLSTFTHDRVVESFGLGIAVTRNFFLTPSIQFVADNFRSDFTNVSINANINLF